jgi:hypothetical protein
MRQHDNYGCPRLTSKRRVPADRPARSGTGDLGSFESRPQQPRHLGRSWSIRLTVRMRAAGFRVIRAGVLRALAR